MRVVRVPLEQRILVLAPTGRDAGLACEVLNGAGLAAEACGDVDALCEAMERGAGAVLLAEEALSPGAQRSLSEALGRQPPWSDLPLVIFAAAVDTSASARRMQQLLGVLGNVTFVDRPLRVAMLVTAMKAALRARNRQYMARETLMALERQEEEARTRADFEQQLIGIVSHDLRNPIHAITLSAAALLRRDGLGEREKSVAARIVSSADRAMRMIRDLLDFTQARLGGGLRIQRAPLDIHELTRQAVEEVSLAYPTSHVAVASEGDGRGEWDADRLVQALGNLVTNAVKYSAEGTPVNVLTRGEKDQVVLEVHNTGTPIPADRLPHLFHPMHRAVARSDPGSRSVGLGLYIVRHIVSAHDGTIQVRSTEAEGTTFTLVLPRQAGGPVTRG
ncbi:MAG TPA: HAMP domain-containing sensor histidine kinase [Myxococcaceae bacterium]|nr:HAMP domain-containing sensor histidine kinase [Myxococcaceae bacterium]